MRFILLLLSLTYLLPLFAEDKSIDLDALITDELRSFTDAPIVTYDGGAICILSDITDVEEILPNVVMTDEDGKKLINYTALIPILINGMQEMQKDIDALKMK